MSFSNILENNPFFTHNMDKICIICHNILLKRQTYSIFDKLPTIDSHTIVFKALVLFSNFKDANCKNSPQKICRSCFNNTLSALKFQRMCNKSVELLENYLQHQQKIENKSNENIAIENASVQTVMLMIESKITPDNIIEQVKINVKNNVNNESKTDFHDLKQRGIKKSINTKNRLKSDKSKARKVKCKYCNKYYRGDYLSSHWRVHTGEKPYTCKVCERKFRNPTDLKKHTVIHDDKRAYLCNVCGDSFKLQSTLLQHSKIHTGERRHECKICGKKFRAHNTLKEHYSVHSSKRPFTCEQCAKCFATRKHLRQHMISHAEVKRHTCLLCGNRFTQAHSLRTHLSKHCKAR